MAKSVCDSALEKFKGPDQRSRTPDNDGRRIEQLEEGWLVLNYIAFRERLSNDPKTVATRERVRKHRERVTKRYVTPEELPSVTSAVSASASVQGKGSGEGGQIPTLKDLKDYSACNGILDSTAQKLFDHYQGKNLWLNRNGRLINWKHELQVWQNRDRENQPTNTNPTNYLNERRPTPPT